jgi:hypothetical protein
VRAGLSNAARLTFNLRNDDSWLLFVLFADSRKDRRATISVSKVFYL